MTRVEELPDEQRVVITGLGAFGPNGHTAEEVFQKIINGESGIDVIKRRKPDGSPLNSKVNIAGEVKDYNPLQYFTERDLKRGRIHESAQYADITLAEAMRDAGFLEDGILAGADPTRFGVRGATGVGGTVFVATVAEIIRTEGDDKIPAGSILKILPERVASVGSMRRKLRGPVAITTAACASASYAMSDAYLSILYDDADIMAVPAAEAPLTPEGIGSFANIRALSTWNDRPKEASRPFDKKHNGFVVAEGGATLILERLSHAKARGAKIYAEFAGYGNTADAGESDTAPTGEGAQRAMTLALRRAGIVPYQLGYINAHGTSTPTGDDLELDAIRAVVGDATDEIPISSTKSSHGHLLGAAPAFEAVITILAMQRGRIPPTLNLEDPVREGFDLVPMKSRIQEIKFAASNSFGFGGLNSVIIFRRWSN